MFKNRETGNYEHDFRGTRLPRYRVTYGTRKTEADRLHAVAMTVWRARDVGVWEALRAGKVTLQQLAELQARGKAFGVALDAALEPWPTLADAVDEYVEWLEGNPKMAAGTARAAKTQLRSAVAHFGGDIRLDQLTSKAVTDYQTMLTKGTGKAGETKRVNTVTKYVHRVGALYRWWIRREALDARDERRSPRVLFVPLNPEEISTEREHRTRYLTYEEAERLLEATPRQLRFPIAAGLFAGLRVDEMCHLRTGADVDMDGGKLYVQKQPNWRPKTKRSIRAVPISDALKPILKEHLERYSNDEWVTPAWRNPSLPLNRHSLDLHMVRVIESAELISGRTDPQGVTYHTLRHTFASWLLMNGADMFTVAKLLGNTVKQVEDTYGHLSQDHTAAAVNRLATVVRMPDATLTGED